jgi:Peptide N-acetyl-beta-D-glucosaminyl asparaginase amidase A
MPKHYSCLSQLKTTQHDTLGISNTHGTGREKRRSRLRFWATLCITFFSALLIVCYYHLAWPSKPGMSFPGNTPPQPVAETGLMNVFQVYQQPAKPRPSRNCPSEVLLMDHVFAFSYGRPFVGSYQPPSSCAFNSISMTLTITSRGRQFDRLALMFLGDVEVFRTSTAEPTADGIRWTYTKDMTPYLSLWREPQKVIFDLGNLVDELYTGTFNATLTATFFEVAEPPQTADLILPISIQRSALGVSSAFSLPFDNATVGQTFPLGVSRAIVSISACGQATEEFWYSNVLSADTDTFLNTTGALYGFSPFREVQLLIDGNLAGVIWPFPIIFTGGIAPGFWRPVVGIDAFDLREPEIDITPWVPWLSDGREHQFQIKVVGLDVESGSVSLSSEVGSYWVVTGKTLIFLDEKQCIHGNADDHGLPSIFAPDPAISAKSRIEQSTNGTNKTLSYSVKASRSVVITSEAGSWVQNLEFQNDNVLSSKGLTQSTTQYTNANFASINFHHPRLSFSVATSYPLSVNTTIGTFDDSRGISIDASLYRGLVIDSTGRLDGSLFTLTSGESNLDTSQFGTAHYSSQPNKSFSFGDTTQTFLESSRQGISIVHVKAVNGSISFLDGEIGQDLTKSSGILAKTPSSQTAAPYRSLRSMVGRGPGRSESKLP